MTALLFEPEQWPKKKPVNSRFRIYWSMFKETASAWSGDRASRLAASLSYYTIFSIAPLMIIAIAVAGLAFGQAQAREQIADQIRDAMGKESSQIVLTLLENSSKKSAGVIASLIGIVTLILGASGAFLELQDALNSIWKVKTKAGHGIREMLRVRLISFSMVLVIGFLLMVTLVISAAVVAVGKYVQGLLPMQDVLMQCLNFGISFGVTILLFALIFKVLPDVHIPWKNVWIGAAVTALFFSLGRFLIGLYLGRGTVGSTYGAAGSVIVFLVWIYYSSQILFFGAEFTQVYAHHAGAKIVPKGHAEFLSEETRAAN